MDGYDEGVRDTRLDQHESRINKLETAQDAVSGWMNRMIGYTTVLAGVVSLLVTYLSKTVT